jgi:hypothetical protein
MEEKMRRGKINLRGLWFGFGMLLGSVAGVWMAAQEPPDELRCNDNMSAGYWVCLNGLGEELCRVQRPICNDPTSVFDWRFPVDCWKTCCEYRYRCGEILCCCRIIAAWKICKNRDTTRCYACQPWQVEGYSASFCHTDGQCYLASGTP